MSNLYLDDFLEGLHAALDKQANEHLFTSANNASLFPNLTSQAKWRYARGNDFLRLHDGQKVYAFKLPSGLSHDEEFAASREADLDPSVFTNEATEHGLAQVHRADPGSIYFTLQEGRNNPTFTLKHTGENTWRGSPKKRKAKESVIPNVDHTALAEGLKAAFAKHAEEGGLFPWLGQKLDQSFKGAVGPGAHALQRAAFSPGEFVHRAGGGGANNFLGSLALGGLGAGAGALYHVGRRALYNTQEENDMEDEQGGTLFKRMAIPGLAAGVLGGVQSSLFDNHYKDLAAGIPGPQ